MAVSFLVYFLSFDSKVHVLACTGNHYITDSQVYELAGVNYDTRMILTPSTMLESRVEDMPLVDSVNVTKKNNKIIFEIEEKVVVGYYQEDGIDYALTIDNEAIQIDEEYQSSLVHVPYMSGFSAKQRKQICKQFKANKDVLTKSVIEKISEMTPYKTSFDKNMVKITMQDGNIVYSSMDSLVMLSKYEAMLTELEGTNVCLMLDAQNSAIEKIDCADVGTSSKKKSSDDDDDEEDEDQEEAESEEETEETVEEQTDTEETSDDGEWITDETTGLQYNIYTGYYRDELTGIQYVYNEETDSFEAVE